MMWYIFFLIIGLSLAVDIFLVERGRANPAGVRNALVWSAVWFSLAIIFNVILWLVLARTETIAIANQKSLEFFSGYLIEKSLSVDNIFVFLMIFEHFKIPVMYQRRVLMYGVVGAIVFRLLFITGGIALVNQFHWILYGFGIFLIFTGIKMLLPQGKKLGKWNDIFLAIMAKCFRITQSIQGKRFFIRNNGVRYATPLFLALVMIELSDILFATDSIPAIFAITRDPFIIFTSNIFAILGLRSLYFLLAHLHNRFTYLKYGLAFILVFVGIKMLLENVIHLSPIVSLCVILGALVVSVVCSVRRTNIR